MSEKNYGSLSVRSIVIPEFNVSFFIVFFLSISPGKPTERVVQIVHMMTEPQKRYCLICWVYLVISLSLDVPKTVKTTDNKLEYSTIYCF